MPKGYSYPEYQKAYYERNKEKYKLKARERFEEVVGRRKNLLAPFSCISCGNSNTYVIEWHHLDPNQRELGIFASAHNEERFWDEVLKCVPLCSNCHTLIHKNLLCLIPQQMR